MNKNQKILYILIDILVISTFLVTPFLNFFDFNRRLTSHNTTFAASVCGDGTCSGWENSSNCPEDCSGGSNSSCICGDGYCNSSCENSYNCPEDCGGGNSCVCGDGYCNSSCENSYNCPEDCGSPPPSCHNECSYSGQTQKRCSGGYVQKRTCGNYDADSCLEWSSWRNYQNCGQDEWTNNYRCQGNWVQREKILKGCSNNQCYRNTQWINYQNCEEEGKICQSGQCVWGCTNECSSIGQKRCADNSSYQVCGDYDSDVCLEWSSPQSCGEDNCIGSTFRNYFCTGWGICSYTDTQCSSPCYSCGDGTCNSECGENSSSCPQDCGYPELNVSCYAQPNPAQVNENVNFIASVSGGTGNYTYLWNGACSGTQSSCSISFSQPGSYCATLTVTSDSQQKSATCSVQVNELSCTDECSYMGERRCFDYTHYQICGNYNSDSCLEWSSPELCSGPTNCGYGSCASNQRPNWYCSNGNCTYNCVYDSGCEQQPSNHLSCYNNDVWWFNSLGQLLSKYQECGDDFCESWGENYCVGNKVYQQRTCYDRGCTGAACYSTSYKDTRLLEECASDETCVNGECKKECECSSGPCCDGCHYKSSAAICDVEVQTQYGCPWGIGCGADVAKRTKSRFRYCSGDSAQCTGAACTIIFRPNQTS